MMAENRKMNTADRRRLAIGFLPLFLALVVTISGNNQKREAEEAKANGAQKIVCLSPASTEICFAIGAGEKVAAVTSYCDYPPAAKDKPVVGGFDGSTISLESILSYEPDLVYLTDGMHNFLIPQLESLGIDYILSTANSLGGIQEEILLVGEKTGYKEEAEKVAGELKSAVKKAKKNHPAPVCIYWEVWNAPYMSAGSSSFIHDVITTCGGKNIFDDCNEAYPIVSEETIIDRQPEIILIPKSSGVTAQVVSARPGWETIPAVKNGKVFIVDDNIYTHPSPRISEALKELSNIVQGK